MIIGASDPGTGKGAGFALWQTGIGLIYVSEFPPTIAVDVAVVESGFIGRMGKQGMWGLGFSACWCLLSIPLKDGGKRFTIRPDGQSGWRAALPEVDGMHKKFDGLPGDVIVNKLRLRYQMTSRSEHQVEACGIAEAAAAIMARPKAKDRKALKAVKR